MYNTANGMGHIKSFLHASHAVRCWYNTEFRSSDRSAASPDILVAGLSGSGLAMMRVPTIKVGAPTRLQYSGCAESIVGHHCRGYESHA
jgi:hypothetical protein